MMPFLQIMLGKYAASLKCKLEGGPKRYSGYTERVFVWGIRNNALRVFICQRVLMVL